MLSEIQYPNNRIGKVSQRYPTPKTAYNGVIGGPGRSPTCDLRVRSALLYATELPGHIVDRDSVTETKEVEE
jgi:hypothetical protein